MNRYDKLYARVDRVFAGTPNTPSALAAKSEILENLTAKFDDLLARGLSEEEAIEQVVESIGDISELFELKSDEGALKEKSSSGAASPNTDTASKGKVYHTYPPEKLQQGRAIQKVLITLAVALYIVSLIAPALCEAGLPDIFGVSVMFGIWGLATAMIVGSGICLPWTNPVGKLMLAAGVGCYIWAFVPMFLLAEISEWLGISLMFAGWAFATLLVIFSTNFKRKGLPTAEGKRIVVEPARPDMLPPEFAGIYKPVSTILTVLTLMVYLGISFWTFGWIYTWLIWVIHGCVCEIIKAIFWLICKSRREL